jgi:hypothetical protein
VGSGSDGGVGSGSDAGPGSGSDGGVGSGSDAGPGSGSGSDAGPGSGSGSDAGPGSGSGSDAGPGSGSDDAGVDTDGGIGAPPTDAAGGLDALRGVEVNELDQTSFYACAGGGSTAGIGLALPIVAGLAIRRRRRRAAS